MSDKGYRKLMVWQKSDELAYAIYAETNNFPREEAYALTSQLRRAALSVPLNLVEGYGRQGRKEFKHFCKIALGSLAETEYLLDFCRRLKYFDEDTYQRLCQLRTEVGRLLWKFCQSL